GGRRGVPSIGRGARLPADLRIDQVDRGLNVSAIDRLDSASEALEVPLRDRAEVSRGQARITLKPDNGAAGVWWPIWPSKPAGRRSPTLGRFDSFAASSSGIRRAADRPHRPATEVPRIRDRRRDGPIPPELAAWGAPSCRAFRG